MLSVYLIALLISHQAISYYEHSLKGGGPPSLQYDLAQLLLKMKRYDKCEKILRMSVEQDETGDVDSMQRRTKYLLLLARVYRQTGRPGDSVTFLDQAIEAQHR